MLIAAKAGLERAAFIDYYENNHAPLVLRLAPFTTDYRRNYLPPDVFGNRDVIAFDCVTELRFPSAKDFQAFVGRLRSPEVSAQIEADEKQFLDPLRTQIFVVDESPNPPGS